MTMNVHGAHMREMGTVYFFGFFKFLIFTYFINISYLKKIYIKMYRKGADASTADTRARRRQRHARTHT